MLIAWVNAASAHLVAPATNARDSQRGCLSSPCGIMSASLLAAATLAWAMCSPLVRGALLRSRRFRRAAVLCKHCAACGAVLPKRRLFVLDRDGVINVDVGRPGVTSVNQFELLPGSASAIRALNAAGHLVAIATNQTSVANGLLTEEGLVDIHGKMQAQLASAEAQIDHILVATRPPRLKPGPAMLLEALELTGMQCQDTVFIGDNITDLQAAFAAGVRGILVTSSNHGIAAAQKVQDLEFGHTVAVYPCLADAVAAELR